MGYFFGQFVKHRTEVVKRLVFLIQNPDPNVNVRQLVDYMAYAFSVLGIQQATIDAPLSATNFFDRVLSSLELGARPPLIRNALKGVARGHA